ncbi:M16 family metallopeptidase [Bacillus sp. S10(2024)]|uniref:M16 family metallopeptidase n=1 Tax=Bacillus sp. S10(2024) TaxID=3162886 RepID=UPI003D1A884B
MEQQLNLFSNNMFHYQLDNGINVSFIKVPEQKQNLAMLTVSCGSYYNQYLDSNDKIVVSPSGMAHFLEHILFDNEEKKIHEQFAENGAMANAFTSYDKTSFFVSTIGDLKNTINILLKTVYNPLFNKSMVDREKEVIKQEISMYQTNHDYQSDIKLMSIFKSDSQFNILGSIEDVEKITTEQLYNYHKTYYQPDNMYLTVMGDFEIEQLFKEIQQLVKTLPHYKIKKFPMEKLNNVSINLAYHEETIRLGWVIPLSTSGLGIESYFIYKIGFEALFGERSQFSYELQKNGDIVKPVQFKLEYINDEFYLVLEMQGKYSDNIKDKIIEYFNKIKSGEIDSNIFAVTKKQIYGDWIHSFDEPFEFIYDLTEVFNLKLTMDTYLNNLMNIKEEKILKYLQKIIDEELLRTIS